MRPVRPSPPPMRIRTPLLVVLCLFAPWLSYAAPRLVPIADATLVTRVNSSPDKPLAMGSYVYFSAQNGPWRQLWRSDGTPAGTSAVYVDGDVRAIHGTLGNAVLFSTPDALWRTDGTAAGTYRLLAFPGWTPDSNYPSAVYPADTRVFIFAGNSSSPQLFVSDGARDGARVIGSIPFPSMAVGANGKLFFRANDVALGMQLWVSDGTPLGTHLIHRLLECTTGAPCGPQPSRMFRAGPHVCYGNASGLYRIDGTPEGTVKLAPMPDPIPDAASKDLTYLISDGKIWRTDGTAAGTIGGEVSGTLHQSAFVLDDGRLAYLAAANPAIALGMWVTDGTTAGTRMFGSLPWNAESILLGISGTDVHALRYPGFGVELWVADANGSDASLVLTIDPDTSRGLGLLSFVSGTPLGARLIFPARDFRGTEPWVSDGTAAGTTILANIAAEDAAGAVTGTVRDATSGSPISGAVAALCSSSGCGDAYSSTNADGRYRFDGVVPGTYKVAFSHRSYAPQYYDATICPACSLATATPVTVSAGFETQNVDASLVLGGFIEGTVRRASTGDGYSASVSIYDSSGRLVDHHWSMDDGRYSSLGLAAGTYYVQASQYWDDQTFPLVDQVFNGRDCLSVPCPMPSGDPVTLTSGQVSTVDFSLRNFGAISGSVIDASANFGVAGAQITFRRQDGLGSTFTTGAGSTGSFISPPLRPGTYLITVSANGFPTSAYPDHVCGSSSDCHLLSAVVDVPVAGTTANVNFSLRPTVPRVAGVVLSANGKYPGVPVSLLDASGESRYYTSASTATGGFAFTNVAPGTYFLLADDEVHPHVRCGALPCSVTGATPVVVTNATTTVVNVQLESRLVTITGLIVDGATDVKLANPQATLWDSDGKQIVTAGGNPYTLQALSRSPSFYVSGDAAGYEATAHSSGRVVCTNSVCSLPAAATPIPAADTTTVDLHLTRLGVIRGTVSDNETGRPIGSGDVFFISTTDPTRSGSVKSDANGQYQYIEAAGSYYISAHEDEYISQVYAGMDCAGACLPQSGTVVVVPPAGEVTGIDFHLRATIPSGEISGRVIDDTTGAVIPETTVYAVGAGRTASALTDAEGRFSITRQYDSPFPAGSYKLYAAPPSPYFVNPYGGAPCTDSAQCDELSGATVTVTAGAITIADFRLRRVRVTGVLPASGLTTGGTLITITGANFVGVPVVTMGGVAAVVESFTLTTIIARTPPGSGWAHVTVQAGGRAVTLSNAFAYVPIFFTDESLVAGMSVRAVHVTELRTIVNALRAQAKLAAKTFTDPVLTGVSTRALHLLELRAALNEARSALGRTALTYANPLTAGSPMRAADIVELRNGVR